MTDRLEWFRENEARIYRYFDTLHAIPEPGFQEVKTSAFLAGELRRLGYAVQDSFARTAVLGTLETGQSGPVVCLRADMDALTFTVDGETKHIHACGHDANCTEVLAAAAAAAETGFLKHGTLKVLFQPCEETMQGALSVLESGVLNDVDYMFGTHLRPARELESGACPAVLHGAMAVARIAVHGRSAHGARPYEGINAVTAGARIVDAVTKLSPKDETPCSIKATRFETAEGSVNIIPAEATIFFDIRAQTNACMDWLKEQLLRITERIAKETGAGCELCYTGGVPAAEASQEAIAYAEKAIRRVCGGQCHEPVITAGGEDFHFYTRHIPGLRASVLGFGAHMKEGLHQPKMSFDRSVLPVAAEVLACVAETIMK